MLSLQLMKFILLDTKFVVQRYHRENWKKAKFHLEAAAVAGHEGARNNIGHLVFLKFNNTDRAIKHWIIAASAGSYLAMNAMRKCFQNRESLNSTLTAYNTSCGEMRSKARDAFICSFLGIDLGDLNNIKNLGIAYPHQQAHFT